MEKAESHKTHRRGKRSVVLPALIVAALITFAAVIGPTLVVRQYHRYSFTQQQQVREALLQTPRVGLVLGGGIDAANNQPRPVLRQRLLAAVQLYEADAIDRIIVSGDNRFENYNEPQVMYDFLVDQGVPAREITRDFAGRSTYESCERAKKVFMLDSVVLVTQSGHLDRAIYLCRSFGLNAYGFVASSTRNAPLPGQVVREILSNTKAVFNVNVIGEQTLLGDPQPIN